MSAPQRRPSVLYVTYEGVTTPLGQSQVLAYLERLVESSEIVLVSFEPGLEGREEIADRLTRLGIRWVPLDYHKVPPVLSTVRDVVAGVRTVRREARRRFVDVLHVRSYVPMLIALGARRAIGAKVLFDIRGFWADERVDAGLWPAGGLLHRVAKRCESRFFQSADAVVTLTEASVPQIRRWMRTNPAPIDVIPTCAEIDRYGSTGRREPGPHAVWCGSVGTWYRFDLAIELAEALALPFTVLTHQVDEARAAVGSRPADVRSVPLRQVPAELHRGDIGLCLYKETFSRVATAPTRFAEYLAAGMPVAVSRGVGDLPALVEQRGVGVVVDDASPESLHRAANRLLEMSGDEEVLDRCEALARERYDVATGTSAYRAIYARLSAAPDGGPA